MDENEVEEMVYEFPACPYCQEELNFEVRKEKTRSILVYICPTHGEINLEEILWLMR